MPQQVRQQLDRLATVGGRALINGLYPNEFEYYAITLELTDSQDKVVDFLTFPVNPNEMEYDHQSVVNIKKNFGGVTALDTESFVPKRYSMSGTFGRKLRLLLSNVDNISAEQSTAKGVFEKQRNGLQIKTAILNSKIKTGYGTMKVLEAIIDKSSGLDQYNKPMRLFLYNPTLGHSFLVKSNGLKIHQDYTTSNMMWKYHLTLTTIAPLARINSEKKKTSLTSIAVMGVLQKGVNLLSNSIKKSVF